MIAAVAGFPRLVRLQICQKFGLFVYKYSGQSVHPLPSHGLYKTLAFNMPQKLEIFYALVPT
jgi:hypothetical protein